MISLIFSSCDLLERKSNHQSEYDIKWWYLKQKSVEKHVYFIIGVDVYGLLWEVYVLFPSLLKPHIIVGMI